MTVHGRSRASKRLTSYFLNQRRSICTENGSYRTFTAHMPQRTRLRTTGRADTAVVTAKGRNLSQLSHGLAGQVRDYGIYAGHPAGR